ncbi:UvrD-helicase domain-containing protein [Desulfobulbus sp. US4]|nr:UvrD-helicase domain-containing protein [Desulfobulbus sp. US4]
MRSLVLASAGAGKSRLIVKQSLEKVALGKKVLILTYTKNNQEELVKKFCEISNIVPSTVTIKGWFTFLLEDMIRPYQSCLFLDRIPNIHFNDKGDPHKRVNPSTKKSMYIRGRKEKNGPNYNPKHFLTSKEGKAHTTYISKLAYRVNSLSKGKPIMRLSEIYQTVCIDEVQDLIGWDFEVMKSLSKSNIDQFCCVGDFRQTLYSTHVTTKKPKDNHEKLDCFGGIGLTLEQLNISWRCTQKICALADLVHKKENVYEPTKSKMQEIDPDYPDHLGVFVVRSDNVEAYLKKYQPTILRASRSSQKTLCNGREAFNFGESKGMGFDRVLICATNKHKDFLAGKEDAFKNDKTSKAKNALYVAITRARFSVAFLYDGVINLDGVEDWPVFSA